MLGIFGIVLKRFRIHYLADSRKSYDYSTLMSTIIHALLLWKSVSSVKNYSML
jgi:hypothetical protein